MTDKFEIFCCIWLSLLEEMEINLLLMINYIHYCGVLSTTHASIRDRPEITTSKTTIAAAAAASIDNNNNTCITWLWLLQLSLLSEDYHKCVYLISTIVWFIPQTFVAAVVSCCCCCCCMLWGMCIISVDKSETINYSSIAREPFSNLLLYISHLLALNRFFFSIIGTVFLASSKPSKTT